MTSSNHVDALLRHRDPLLRIARETHQAAGPKWSQDIAEFFDRFAEDPGEALGREATLAITTTIASLIIAEGITVATGPDHARSLELRSSPGFDAAVAAAADLVHAVAQQDPNLGRAIYVLMTDHLGAYLAAVERLDAVA
jgi:hypothetical protein